MDPENKNFEKIKKAPEDIILQICTINNSHMMYGSWDTQCNRQIFFVILDHFLPFYPHNIPEHQNFEKIKKPPGDIIILHSCNINDNHIILRRCNINNNHIMYGSWDTKRDKIFCHFGIYLPLALLPPKNLKKTPGTHVYHKWQSYDVWFLRYWAWQNFLSFWTIFCPFTPLPG